MRETIISKPTVLQVNRRDPFAWFALLWDGVPPTRPGLFIAEALVERPEEDWGRPLDLVLDVDHGRPFARWQPDCTVTRPMQIRIIKARIRERCMDTVSTLCVV